jgi:hypothetical protein
MILSGSAVQVKHAGIDRNPETRVFGLWCATLGAFLLAELFDLIVITRPLRAFERRRRLGSKMRWARQGERGDVRDCPADRDRSGYVNDGPGLWPVSVGGRGSIIPQPTSSTRSPVRRLSAARTTPRRTARSCDSAIACCRLGHLAGERQCAHASLLRSQIAMGRPSQQPDRYTVGLIFWLWRKRLVGS